jgi:hypothetical protein
MKSSASVGNVRCTCSRLDQPGGTSAIVGGGVGRSDEISMGADAGAGAAFGRDFAAL